MPQIRKVVAQFQTLELPNVLNLLASKIHEERLLALLILVSQFKRSDAGMQDQIVDAYLANLRYVNNWDLVDSSAQYILGASLLKRNGHSYTNFRSQPDFGIDGSPSSPPFTSLSVETSKTP